MDSVGRCVLACRSPTPAATVATVVMDPSRNVEGYNKSPTSTHCFCVFGGGGPYVGSGGGGDGCCLTGVAARAHG